MARAHLIIPDLTEKDIARFWSKVRIHWNNPDACWPWTGCKNTTGYGRFRIEPFSYSASRMSYIIYRGSIAPGMGVCHHCDNPACVNPKHLFAGSQLDNIRDALRKGRMSMPKVVRGALHPRAKLTEPEVMEIRRLSTMGISQRNIAKMFNSGKTTIGRIVRRESWNHVI